MNLKKNTKHPLGLSPLIKIIKRHYHRLLKHLNQRHTNQIRKHRQSHIHQHQSILHPQIHQKPTRQNTQQRSNRRSHPSSSRRQRNSICPNRSWKSISCVVVDYSKNSGNKKFSKKGGNGN